MTEFIPPEETPVASSAGQPHSREAEEAVLGAVLINPEVYYDLAQFLQPEDFFIHRLRWVWEAFTRLHEARTPIDMLTVSEDLERNGQLVEVGGAAYLTALLNQVPTTLHAEAYGRMIESASIRRKMLTAANQIATLAYDESEKIDTVMGEAEKAIFNVSERKLRHDVLPIRTVLSEYYDRMGELAGRTDEEIFGVPTGFIDLDRMLGGLQNSDLLILAGRPGTGKSAMLLTIAHNAALIHKKRVAIFSLEMSNEQVVQRMISQETGIDSHRLRTGKLNEDDWSVFTHAIEVLSDTKIHLDDTPALTPLQLRTKCRRLHMEYGIDLIILDYLQLMSGETRTDNRVQEVSYISRSLKALARELNIPLLSAAQLSRAVEQRADKEPVLSDLRESGCITGDTLVTLADSGRNVPIHTLEGKENFNIWALNPQIYKLEAVAVSRAFTTGVKPVYQMTTRLGRTIRATANHRFLSIRGWQRLDELMADDYVALPRTIASPKAQMQAEIETAYCGTGLYKQNISRERAAKVANVVQSPELASLAQSDVYWDSILSILPDGEAPVFDLTVPGHHNFLANNIIVHNSLEQDADIVMFIHHPDEKDPAMQSVTHLKIAKHRNGPVGQVDLIFRANLTKFENAATRKVDLNE